MSDLASGWVVSFGGSVSTVTHANRNLIRARDIQKDVSFVIYTKLTAEMMGVIGSDYHRLLFLQHVFVCSFCFSRCHHLLCLCVSQQASQQSSPQAVWVVPALRQLHEITRSFIKQTYQKQDKVRHMPSA